MSIFKKYIIDKSNIYVGKLIKPIDISVETYAKIYDRLSEAEKIRIKKTKNNICAKDTIRPIIFRMDNDCLAHDLVFDIKESYPVQGIKPLNRHQSEYIIEEAINISTLLTYLDYKEYLTKHEIKRIYQLLILSSEWLKENVELFGYREIFPDTYLPGGNEQINHEIFDILRELEIIVSKKPSKEEIAKTRVRRKLA